MSCRKDRARTPGLWIATNGYYGERLAFKERFELPENLWIWAGRYDGVRAMHAVQRRSLKAPKGTPRIYSLTLTANFLTLQLFAYRESEGDLARMANATLSERFLQLWPPAPDWLSWPPPIMNRTGNVGDRIC